MRVIVIIIALAILPLAGQAQKVVTTKPVKHFLWFKINKFDKEGRMHGRWKVFFGKDDTVIRNGRFRHGNEVGNWKYYYPDGTRYMKEKYRRNSEVLQVTKYHENGKLARKGEARLIKTSTMDRYFWFGDWEVYDTDGEFSHIEMYESGNLVGRK
ncbi:toxin-antitoxin system YwqK family antitoxin [Pontibacter cellulosilyticus]|uniref:MORN repeat variant n=1 Tax=Pontibacter cellulosilyticus TaxID=1720253 RepID=A0A923N488_9BACT|nr:hypothetical protein [Pontibacter cellulosilyticus]MBC5991574.1 hypothetical protein [Pontibacter cellulosilyticus]